MHEVGVYAEVNGTSMCLPGISTASEASFWNILPVCEGVVVGTPVYLFID